MNITKLEYTIIQDILMDEDYPEDVAPEKPLTIAEGRSVEEETAEEEKGNEVADNEQSPAKKRKVDSHEPSLYAYKWKFVNGTGEVLKVSDDVFLDRDQCICDGDDHAPDVAGNCDSDITLKLKKIKVVQPTAELLVTSVYRYLMNMEYKFRVKQQCYGCQNDRCSQVDHMSGGCLDEQKTLVEMHARACHLRVSTPRLQLATEAMQIYFPQVRVPYSVYKTLLKHINPRRILMNTDTIFFHEYCTLDKL